MFQRAALVSLFLGVALAGPASAQISLRWKFQEGDIFWIEEKITAKTDVTANGDKFTDEQTQYRLSKFEVKNSTADLMIIQQRIEVWQSKITGRPTGNEDDTERLEKLCKSIVFTMYMSPVGKITRYDGYDKFLANFAKEYPDDAKQFKALTGNDDEWLRGPLAQVFDVLAPESAKGLKKGQTWQRDSSVKLGPLGRFKLATTFTYVGKEGQRERVDTKGILT
ncbi:MAG TPA: DUF6263 family protein, partial [Gemmataceae bacterium]|nr:DUF6263 family protein [Gemmataceae bacterium]